MNFPVAPPQASNFAAEHDAIFWALSALTAFFTLLVGVLVIFFAIKYRKGTKVDRSRPVYEHLKLELTWTIVPTIMALIMFYFGANLFLKMRTPPKDASEIFVIGKQWMWHIQHSNGVRENNTLHVPLGKPIKLTMISQDVIHAFYVPAFRTQMHVVPGRYTTMWFTPTRVGEYHLFCGMYCGTQHSEMGGKVVVMEPRAFAEWLANGGNTVQSLTMEQAGARLYQRLACDNCHGGTDTPRGPSLYALFGKQRTFSNAGAVRADLEYVRESILRPHNKLTTGYEKTMPEYEGQISEEELLNLMAFIRTMSMPTPAGMDSSMTSAADGRTNTAMQAEAPGTDPTVINRTGNPSVGAVAAEERNSR